jgi:hypothetical protein
VAHLANGHYVALFELRDGRRAVVGDPARGLGELPLEEFQRDWSGSLLLLSPGGLGGASWSG